jgi:amino acid transporter
VWYGSVLNVRFACFCTAGFDDLVDMVSISTLFAFWMVALALLWNRYHKPDVSPRPADYKVAAHLVMIVAASLGEFLGRRSGAVSSNGGCVIEVGLCRRSGALSLMWGCVVESGAVLLKGGVSGQKVGRVRGECDVRVRAVWGRFLFHKPVVIRPGGHQVKLIKAWGGGCELHSIYHHKLMTRGAADLVVIVAASPSEFVCCCC